MRYINDITDIIWLFVLLGSVMIFHVHAEVVTWIRSTRSDGWIRTSSAAPSSLPPCLLISCYFTLYGLRKRNCMIPEFNKPNQTLWSACKIIHKMFLGIPESSLQLTAFLSFLSTIIFVTEDFHVCLLEEKKICQYCVARLWGRSCVLVNLWPFFSC